MGALTHVFSKHGLPPVIPALPYTIVTDNPQPTGKHWEKYGASGLGLEIVHEVQRRTRGGEGGGGGGGRRVGEAPRVGAHRALAEQRVQHADPVRSGSPSSSLLPLTPSPPPPSDAWARGRRRGPARVRRVRAGVDCARLAAQLGAGEARRGAGGVAGGEGGGAAAGGARRRRAELLAAEGRRPQARPRAEAEALASAEASAAAAADGTRSLRAARPSAAAASPSASAASGRGCAPRRASTAARTASTAASPSGSRSTGEELRRRTSRIRCE